MATDVSPQTQPSMSGLVGGIIDDTQKLLVQQADLLKADIRKDLREAKDTGLAFGLCGALLGGAGIVLLFMLVHLLEWAFRDKGMEMWHAHGIVVGVLAVAGGVAFYLAKQKLDKLNPLPENTVAAVKETVQWQTNANPK